MSFRLHRSWLWCIQYKMSQLTVTTLRPRQDGRHFPEDIFIYIFLNENEWHSIKISLKFVPKVPINNIPALVQMMAWHQPGDKPLSEPMKVVLPTHICTTRPQWVNRERSSRLTRLFKIKHLKKNCLTIKPSKPTLLIYICLPWDPMSK